MLVILIVVEWLFEGGEICFIKVIIIGISVLFMVVSYKKNNIVVEYGFYLRMLRVVIFGLDKVVCF